MMLKKLYKLCVGETFRMRVTMYTRGNKMSEKIVKPKIEDVIIRPMLNDDIEMILHNYSEQGWEKPREVIEGYFIKQRNDDAFVFVADYCDNLAGYTILYSDTNVGPYANNKIPVISDFIVFEKYQRKGIGSKILDAAELKASQLSDSVQLAVGLHSGYGAAQRVYAKRGYIPDGSGVWYKESVLEPYNDCQNDDELILYLIKSLRTV